MEPLARADKLYELAAAELDVITPGELSTWREHPCTRNILFNLEGDLEAVKESWAQGNFTHETSSATIQENASMIGMAMALQKTIDYLKHLHIEREEDTE